MSSLVAGVWSSGRTEVTVGGRLKWTLQSGHEMRSTPRHVAIFDFDCTLTRFHVWGKFRALPLAQIPIDKATFVDSVRSVGR